jgi:hypothetical protein
MQSRLPAVLITAACFALAVPARADGLKAGHVPADARWVVHFDVEALAASSVRPLLHEAMGQLHRELHELAAFPNVKALDPLRDVHSMTFYGSSTSPEDAVVLVSGSAQLETAMSDLGIVPGYRKVPAGNGVLHAWEDGDQAWFAYVHALPATDGPRNGAGRRLVIFSDDEERLLGALDVVIDRRADLDARKDARIQVRPRAGSILFVAGVEGIGEWIQEHTHSDVANLARAFSLDVGEHAGRVHAAVKLETETPEDAVNVTAVLQGILALAPLVSEGSEQGRMLVDLAQAVRLRTSSGLVEIDFEYETQRLVDMVHQLHR